MTCKQQTHTLYDYTHKQKKILRQKIRRRLLDLTDPIIKTDSRIIRQKLFNLAQFQEAKTIFIYLAQPQEVQTKAIIEQAWKAKKTVLVPKLKAKSMQAVEIKNFANLKVNRYGVFEPSKQVFWQQKIDLAVVPGLAFSQEGWRLGRGGGYYDYFFQRNPSIYKIGLAFPQQIVEKIPIFSHDQQLDQVLSSVDN